MNSRIIFGLIGTILLIGMVSAFGIVTYGEPVKLRPGETIDLQFGLQNMVGDGSYSVSMQIGADPEIELTLLDNKTVYDLPAKTELPVRLRIKLAEDAVLGNNYSISASFIAAPSTAGETLGIQTAIGSKILIQASDFSDDTDRITPKIPEQIETPKSNTGKIFFLILLVAIVGLVIYYVHRRNREKQDRMTSYP